MHENQKLPLYLIDQIKNPTVSKIFLSISLYQTFFFILVLKMHGFQEFYIILYSLFRFIRFL